MLKLRRELMFANVLLLNLVLGIGLVTSLLSVYLYTIGISLINVGLIFAFGAIIAGVLRIVIGAAVDCYGKKFFVIIGAIGFPSFAIGVTLARTVPQFIGLDIMLEIFAAICWTAFSAHYFDLLSKGREGIEMGQRNLFYYAATASAPVLAGLLADRVGFINLFYIGALISGIGIPMAAAALKNHNQKRCVKFKTFEDEFKDVLKIKGYKTIFYVMFMNNITWTFWSIYMPIFLNSKGYDFAQIGLIVTVMMIVGALIQIPLGKAIDKYPAKWLLIPGFGLIFLGSMLFFAIRNFGGYMLGRAVNGMGWDLSYWPAVGIFARVTPKKEHGAAWGILMAGVAISYGIGAIMGGFLTDRYGIEKVLYASGFIALLVGISLIGSKFLSQRGHAHLQKHHAIHFPRAKH